VGPTIAPQGLVIDPRPRRVLACLPSLLPTGAAALVRRRRARPLEQPCALVRAAACARRRPCVHSPEQPCPWRRVRSFTPPRSPAGAALACQPPPARAGAAMRSRPCRRARPRRHVRSPETAHALTGAAISTRPGRRARQLLPLRGLARSAWHRVRLPRPPRSPVAASSCLHRRTCIHLHLVSSGTNGMREYQRQEGWGKRKD
jgi:hypothetical protein